MNDGGLPIEHMTAKAKLALNNPAFHLEGGHVLFKNVLEILMHKGLKAIEMLYNSRVAVFSELRIKTVPNDMIPAGMVTLRVFQTQ